MTKNYRGRDITLDEQSGKFRTLINGSFKQFASMKSAQNAIDRDIVYQSKLNHILVTSNMEKDYRKGQEVIATIEIEDKGQDFIELDVLANGVILGNSVMFSHGRLSLLGIGSTDGMEYHDFKEFVATPKKERTNLAFKGLTIYMKDTGEKDPLPWNATTLKYQVIGVKKADEPDRFIK